MKITKLGSATVVVELNNLNILCDPWLTDGIYYGSWCNYPPIDLKKINFNAIDYIYISHIHPDHFDENTLKYINKKTPVLIHSYHKKFLKFNIEKLGFKVIELENAAPFDFGNGSQITIYAADNCDPSICGKMFGCTNGEINGSMQLDSLCVIQNEKYTLVNTNDCPYEICKDTIKQVKAKYEKIDFLLVGYTSASLFPHCMMDYNKEEMKNGIEIAKLTGLNSGKNIINALSPKYFMPFAGTYILGGKYYKKNKNLPLPEFQEAIEFFHKNEEGRIINSIPILLNFNQNFDLTKDKPSAEYEPIDPIKRENYINTIAKDFLYTFENDPMPLEKELLDLFNKASLRLRAKQLELNFFENINLIFDLNKNKFLIVNLIDTEPKVVDDISHIANYHRFKLDTRLLKRSLMGPKYANWNNIEIGAMLEFSRSPDVYRMEVHNIINSMHI